MPHMAELVTGWAVRTPSRRGPDQRAAGDGHPLGHRSGEHGPEHEAQGARGLEGGQRLEEQPRDDVDGEHRDRRLAPPGRGPEPRAERRRAAARSRARRRCPAPRRSSRYWLWAEVANELPTKRGLTNSYWPKPTPNTGSSRNSDVPAATDSNRCWSLSDRPCCAAAAAAVDVRRAARRRAAASRRARGRGTRPPRWPRAAGCGTTASARMPMPVAATEPRDSVPSTARPMIGRHSSASRRWRGSSTATPSASTTPRPANSPK